MAISALISAIISTGFGLAVVSQSTVLQMRAQAREEAVRELSAVARDLQRQLLRHQDSDSPKGLRSEETMAMDDLSDAHRVIAASSGLGRRRQRQAMLLARRLFGDWIVERARLMPDDSSDAAVISWFGGAIKESNTQPARSGSWHNALAAPSTSRRVFEALEDLQELEGKS